MTWYGTESIVQGLAEVELLRTIPKLQQFAVRRLAYEVDKQTNLLGQLLSYISDLVAKRKDADAAVC